jgi:tetratricopeptide (TPR) repeat protein
MPTGQVGRYPVLGEIGRGGMGVVLHGRDPELERDLALKVMLGDPAAHPEAVQRFREEAQVGGQLQHPGVVPVYELGNADDGRPYFTMKLVKGETLAKLLKERASPAQERPRFLKVFEQMCQTMAYAHAKGVIHRDLKPANVMVGAFGEVQVMDWGLAKVLASGEGAPRPPLAGPSVVKVSRADSGNAETQEGDVLGTPAYMPPEQALGEVNRLDPRCDVFSLGAILCEVLTGRPPYIGADRIAVLRQARRAELGEALERLDACEADEELVGLARRCLSSDPSDRPRDAGKVAKAVETYLAGVEERARQAELERAAAEARAEEARARQQAERKQAEEAQARAVEAEGRAVPERRSRRLTVWLSASVLLLVVAGGSGAWLVQQQRVRQREATGQRQAAERRAVEGGLARIVELRREKRWKEAWEALEQTRARLGEDGPDDLRQRLTRESFVLDRVDRLEAVRMKSIHHLHGESDFASVDREYAQVFLGLGIVAQREEPERVASGVRQSEIAGHLLAALDAWASVTPDEGRRAWLLAVGRQVDSDEVRDRLRDPAAWKDPAVLKRRLKEVQVAKLTPPLVVALGMRLLRPRGYQADGVRLLTVAQRQHPNDFWLALTLGYALTATGKKDEGASYFRIALALRPETAILWVLLGEVLHNKGQPVEAIAHYQKAIDVQRDYAGAYFNLGIALAGQKKLAEAVAAYQKAIQLRPDDAVAYANLSNTLREQKKLDEAVAACRQAIALQPGYADAYTNLGAALYDQKKLDEAVAAFRKAIALKPDLVLAYCNLGTVLHVQKKLVEAEAVYRKALALQPDHAPASFGLGNALVAQKKLDEAVAAFRKTLQLQPDDAKAHYNLGETLRAQKKFAEAEAAFRKTIDLQPDLAEAYNALGALLCDNLHRPAEAEAAFRKAIALNPDDAVAYFNLGNALSTQKKLREAEAAYRKALDLQPNSAPAYGGLGNALAAQKKLDEAVNAYRKALALQPDDAETYNALGAILWNDLDRPAEAEAAVRKAIALKPDDAKAYYNLGNALAAQKKLVEAVVAFRKALVLQPDLAQAYGSLGNALSDQKKPVEAEAAYRKALALQPDLAPAYGGLGNALRAQKKLVEAEAAYRKAIALRPDLAPLYNNLGSALRDQKKLVEALAAYRKADQLAPNHPVIRNNLRLTLRWLELDRQLPALLTGKAKPSSPQEQLELARFCFSFKERHWVAVRFFTDAFSAEPKLANDLNAQHRYNAACAAALAAANKGVDASKLDAQERARLRQQALDWLRADLTAYTRLVERGNQNIRQAVQQRLAHWQEDPDLAAVRDAKPLAALPEKERVAWQQLWADVAALCKKVETKK